MIYDITYPAYFVDVTWHLEVCDENSENYFEYVFYSFEALEIYMKQILKDAYKLDNVKKYDENGQVRMITMYNDAKFYTIMPVFQPEKSKTRRIR